jgi:hypothetical protein
MVAPGSTARRAVTSGGSTSSRCVLGCASNSSMQGIATTRTRTPSAASVRAAASVGASSLPVDIRISCGR